MFGRHIANLVTQLQGCKRLNKFDRAFLREFLALFPHLKLRQLSPAFFSFQGVDLYTSVLQTSLSSSDTSSYTTTDSGYSSESDYSSSLETESEWVSCEIPFLMGSNPDLEHVDWLKIYEQRSRRIADDPNYDPTFIFSEISNRYWMQFLFAYVLKKHPETNYLKVLLNAKNVRDPILLQLLTDCVEYKLELVANLSVVSGKRHPNYYVFSVKDDALYFVNQNGKFERIDVDEESTERFIDELFGIFDNNDSTTVSVLRLQTLIVEHGGLPTLDLRQFYLDSNGLILHYLPANILRFTNKCTFSTFVDFVDVKEQAFTPVDLYRIRCKREMPQAYFDGMYYKNFWDLVEQRQMILWQSTTKYKPELCRQLPELDLIKEGIIYIQAHTDSLTYRVVDSQQNMYTSAIKFSELVEVLQIPVTQMQIDDSFWQIQKIVEANNHIVRQPNLPKILLPQLVEIIDHYFLVYQENETTALKQLRIQLTFWSKHFRKCHPNDINYLYGQEIYVSNGSSELTFNILNIFADCFDNTATLLNEKLLGIVEFLIDFDAEYACVSRSVVLSDLYATLEVGKSFTIKSLKSVLLHLSKDASPGLKEKLNALTATLKMSSSIDAKIMYLLNEIYSLRISEQPNRYKLQIGVDYWWIRLAQLLAGAGFLQTNYHQFLNPKLASKSLTNLAKIRSTIPDGELYFSFLGKTYANYDNYLMRPVVLPWKTYAEIPRQVLGDLLEIIDLFFDANASAENKVNLLKHLKLWERHLQSCSSDDVDYFFTRRVGIGDESIYLSSVLLDLLDWANHKPYAIHYDKLLVEIEALSTWLCSYDASLVGKHSSLLTIYHHVEVGPGFTLNRLKQLLIALKDDCSATNLLPINTLLDYVDAKTDIDALTLMSLCKIFEQNSLEIANSVVDYPRVKTNNWILIAQLLQGAGFFSPYKIQIVTAEDEEDAPLQQINFKLIGKDLCYRVMTPLGVQVLKVIPQNKVPYELIEPLESASQLAPYEAQILYYISSEGDILPQNYHGLLFWPMNPYLDVVRLESTINYHIRDFTRAENGVELILYLNCLDQFLAERTFGYCNAANKPLTSAELSRALETTKYAPYVLQARFLAQGQPLDFEVALALYVLANDALFPEGLEPGVEYSSEKFQLAERAFNRFILYYKNLSPNVRDRLNNQRIIYYGKNMNFSEALNRTGHDRFCMAVTGFQAALFAVDCGPFKFKPAIELEKRFIEAKEDVPGNKTFRDLNQVANRAYALLVDLMTRTFPLDSRRTHALTSVSFWDCSNNVPAIAKSMHAVLFQILRCNNDLPHISDLYVRDILSNLVTPVLYSSHTLSAANIAWLRSVFDDSLFQFRNFYEASTLLMVLAPFALRKDSYTTNMNIFLEELLQTETQVECPVQKKIRVNVKFVNLMKRFEANLACDLMKTSGLPSLSSLTKQSRSLYILMNKCNLLIIQKMPKVEDLRKRARSTYLLCGTEFFYFNSIEGSLLPIRLASFEIAKITKIFKSCSEYSPLSDAEYANLSTITGHHPESHLYYYHSAEKSLTKIALTSCQCTEIGELFQSRAMSSSLNEYDLKRLSLMTGHTPTLCQEIWCLLAEAASVNITEQRFCELATNYLMARLDTIGARISKSTPSYFATAPIDALNSEVRLARSITSVIATLKNRLEAVPSQYVSAEKLQLLEKISASLTVANIRQGMTRNLTY